MGLQIKKRNKNNAKNCPGRRKLLNMLYKIELSMQSKRNLDPICNKHIGMIKQSIPQIIEYLQDTYRQLIYQELLDLEDEL